MATLQSSGPAGDRSARPQGAPPGAPTGGARVVPVVLPVVVALAVLLGAVLVTGAVAPGVPGLPDAGTVVRWGIPLVRVLHDLAAALTVGLLVVAATIVPETGRPAGGVSRRVVAVRYAALTSVVWVVAGVVGLVLSFADVDGRSVTSPGFAQQIQVFLLSFDVFRAAALSAALALVVATGAALARSRAATVALAGLSVVAVLPLALAGHAAGSSSHDTAVSSLAVHLVAAVLWVGGLLALVVLRPVLGPALAVSVARFSTLAGWCFGAVAVSGVLNAWVRLGSLGALLSPYGLLVGLKVVALGALGAAGWRQRRLVVGRLGDGDDAARALFWRLAATETAVMGAAFGLAVALSRSAPPVPDRSPDQTSMVQSLTGYGDPGPLTASGWFGVWRVDWLWLSLALVAVGLYGAGVLRLRRRGDTWPAGRTVGWVAGWAVFVWATSGAPGVYGRVLFSAHMVMHMVISMAVPIALVLAAPVTVALRTLRRRPDDTLGPRELLLGLVHSRLLKVLGNPVVAAVLFFGSLVVFYYSPLFELALRTHTGHVLMVAHFLLTGYLFVWVLVGVDPGPPKWPASLRLVVLFATISFHAFFGVALTTGTSLLAPSFYTQLHLPWSTDLLGDQQAGGAVAWGVGELPTLLLAMLVAASWMRSDAAETRRHDRQADRDDDAELKAYNAHLAAVAAATRAREGAGRAGTPRGEG